VHNSFKILAVIIFIACLTVSIAGADNTTEKFANSTKNQTVKEPNINVTHTNSAVEKSKQNFRVGPTVRLRPLNSEIDKSQDGLVELFLSNPSVNECPMEFDLEVSVPSDIYIYAEDGSLSGGAGAVTGHFTMPPGSSRTVTLHIKGENVGTFSVHFGGIYWPGTNKNKWNPITLDTSFEVKEPATTPTPASATASDSVFKTIPGFGAVGLVLIFTLMFFLRRN
jgi:hypothetical protein